MIYFSILMHKTYITSWYIKSVKLNEIDWYICLHFYWFSPCRYYEVRVEYQDFYKVFRPSIAKDMFDGGLFTKLPRLSETDPQALYVRPGMYML